MIDAMTKPQLKQMKRIVDGGVSLRVAVLWQLCRAKPKGDMPLDCLPMHHPAPTPPYTRSKLFHKRSCPRPSISEKNHRPSSGSDSPSLSLFCLPFIE